MRIAYFLKKENIGLSTLKIIFEYIGVDIVPSYNMKLSESDYHFLKCIYDGGDFNTYFETLVLQNRLKRNSLTQALKKLYEGEPLSTLEKHQIFNYLYKKYKYVLIKNKDFGIIFFTEAEYNEYKFEKISAWYVFCERKRIDLVEKGIFTNSASIVQCDCFELEDWIEEKHKTKVYYDVDREEAVMRALDNGDGDLFGLG